MAIVVTHNRLSQLQTTMTRLLETVPLHLSKLVVVDNASDDGTGHWLEQLTDPRLEVLRLEVNQGGAGGFAAGMQLARDRFDPDWMVVMDDDARPEDGALERFHELESDNWDALASAVYFPDGRICDMNRPSQNPFWHRGGVWRVIRGGRDGFHIPRQAYDDGHIRPIDVTSFVGFFISRRALDLAGLPDPGVFLYGDDGLYSLGMSAAGGRIGFAPHIRFEHDCSTFSAAQRGRFNPLWKAYYYHRNLLMLYRAAAGWRFWPVLAVVIPKWFMKVTHHAGSRRKFLGLLIRAIRDGLRRNTNVPHAQVIRWSGGE